MKHPAGKLETNYSRIMVSFFNHINKEYIKAARQLAAEKEYVYTQNAVRPGTFLLDLKKKIIESKFFQRVVDTMAGVIPDVEKRIVKDLTKAYRRKGFPIPEMKLQADSQAMQQSIAENVDLIRSVTLEHINDMEKAVQSALINGSSFTEVVDEVLKQSEKGIEYAEFVARDQVGKAYADISEQKQVSVGVEKYEWVSTNDSRTRKSHAVHNGQVYSWDDPPLIDFSLDGQKDRPPERLHPGRDYQCRCISVPVFD